MGAFFREAATLESKHLHAVQALGKKLLPIVFSPNEEVNKAARHYQVSTYAEKVKILTPIVAIIDELTFQPSAFDISISHLKQHIARMKHLIAIIILVIESI